MGEPDHSPLSITLDQVRMLLELSAFPLTRTQRVVPAVVGQATRVARSWSCRDRTAAGRWVGGRAARSASSRRSTSSQRRERTVGSRRSAVSPAGTARSRSPAVTCARDNHATWNTALRGVPAGSVRPSTATAPSSRARQSREVTPASVSAPWARQLSRLAGQNQVR
jgi:hypothetical protein